MSAPSDKLEQGDLLEIRVAELWFWEGSWARRGVMLRRHIGTDSLEITDLDLLAYNIGAALTAQRSIGESKSGEGKSAPKPLDRVIWLAGLTRLMSVQHAELTTQISPDGRVRRLANSLGVRAQSVDDLARREKAIDVSAVSDTGSQGVTVAQAWMRARSAATDPELHKTYYFLKGDVHTGDPWLAAKLLISLVRSLSNRHTPALHDAEQKAVRLMLCEAVSVFCLLAVELASIGLTLPVAGLASEVDNRLSETSVPLVEQRRLAEAFDKYLVGLLVEANVSERQVVASTGAFFPKPPEYSPAVTELLKRLADAARDSRPMPRLADLVIFERCWRQRQETDLTIKRLGITDVEASMRSFRSVVTFLKGNAGLHPDIADALLA